MISRNVLDSLGFAGLVLGGAVAFKLAGALGLIPAQTAGHGFQVILGVMLAAYGNVIPKRLVRTLDPERARRLQGVRRASGWAMTLAGLVYALAWLATPEAVAFPVSITAVALAGLVTLVGVVTGCLRPAVRT